MKNVGASVFFSLHGDPQLLEVNTNPWGALSWLSGKMIRIRPHHAPKCINDECVQMLKTKIWGSNVYTSHNPV